MFSKPAALSWWAGLSVSLLLAVPAWAADWPQFRGPTGQGHAQTDNLPVQWSREQNVAWRVAVPGQGWSSPVVMDRRVYLTTSVPLQDSDDQSLRAMCLSAESGETLWDEEVFLQQGGEAAKIHSKNSHASPTPLVHENRLYVHFGHEGTACLSLDGQRIWENRELRYKPVHGNGGSPIVVDDKLVFSIDGLGSRFLVALSLETGAVIWKTDRTVPADRDFSFSTPLLITAEGRRQIVSPGSDMAAAYAPTDGAELWRVRYDGYSVVPRPVFGHGLAYICTGFGPTTLLAIRPTGTGDVTESHVAWRYKDSSVPRTPSLLLVGEELYMIGNRGIAVCLDAETGAEHWKERIGGNFSASPVFADGRIYLQDEQGESVVLKPGPEFEIIARSSIGEPTLASLAIADGAIFLRSESALYRIESKP